MHHLIRWFQAEYSSEKGVISLIMLTSGCKLQTGKERIEFVDDIFYGNSVWGIYCLDGNLFPDVERYDNLFQATKRIKNLLK